MTIVFVEQPLASPGSAKHFAMAVNQRPSCSRTQRMFPSCGYTTTILCQQLLPSGRSRSRSRSRKTYPLPGRWLRSRIYPARLVSSSTSPSHPGTQSRSFPGTTLYCRQQQGQGQQTRPKMVGGFNQARTLSIVVIRYTNYKNANKKNLCPLVPLCTIKYNIFSFITFSTSPVFF